jgi:hypothetical protein
MSVESLRRFIKKELAKYGIYPNPDITEEILTYLKFAGVPGKEKEEAKRIIRSIVYALR